MLASFRTAVAAFAEPLRGRWGGVGSRVALVLFAAFALLPARAMLPPDVERLLREASIPNEALAFVAMRADSGAVVAEQGARRPMQPASTMKVLTSVVALDRLGLAWRSRSELATDGLRRDGVLVGNLYLRGFGDTDLDVEAFRALLQRLRDSGIDEIRGDLLLARDWFDPPRPDLGVPPFDETPEFRYNAIPDAIFLNSNLLEVTLIAEGEGVRVRYVPALPGVRFTPRFTLAEGACADWEDGWQLPQTLRAANGDLEVVLGGSFPKNCIATTRLNVLDRNEFAARLFRSLWHELGGRFDGSVRDAPPGSATARLTMLAEHRSRPFAEVLRDIDKRSDNPMARLTYLALAERGEGAGASQSTAARAAQTVRAWLRAEGIDDAGLVLDNGSGLSRTEKISPLQLAQVVRAALTRPWAPEFLANLPVAGLDGGLQRRLATPALRGRARLKTGTLRDVTALAGVLPSATGETWVVVAMLNHANATSRVSRPILDQLMLALAAGFDRRADERVRDGIGP
ncbi:MAG: D-alanyl-D-alanine carboxypeptidase/D-alanyl-D-alanine-endopeptidase [Proteobacteria bacterium]|nr:D-alanyl-D-alanine carboxypeptidase/D-alanyl-D-alanine-endopeptidase [Pseudomonadota bacterium]